MKRANTERNITIAENGMNKAIKKVPLKKKTKNKKQINDNQSELNLPSGLDEFEKCKSNIMQNCSALFNQTNAFSDFGSMKEEYETAYEDLMSKYNKKLNNYYNSSKKAIVEFYNWYKKQKTMIIDKKKLEKNNIKNYYQNFYSNKDSIDSIRTSFFYPYEIPPSLECERNLETINDRYKTFFEDLSVQKKSAINNYIEVRIQGLEKIKDHYIKKLNNLNDVYETEIEQKSGLLSLDYFSHSSKKIEELCNEKIEKLNKVL